MDAAFVGAIAVFSTYVEVILKKRKQTITRGGFLHVCGGDPGNQARTSQTLKFSPRMWR